VSIRAKPGEIEFAERLKFGSALSYTVSEHPPELIEEDNYFLPVQNYLAPGDEIRVTSRRDDATWDKALFEVVESSPKRVIVERITDWRHGGVRIIRGLKAVHAGHGTWKVLDDDGREVAKSLTKDEATKFVGQPSGLAA
jgi:hypothetical protein